MSNTRRAESGKPFRQERFSSSAEFERGLMANLVARRCEVLENSDDRELVWFIQYLSHQEGGLKPIAAKLTEKYSSRIGTASMRKFGCGGEQIYDAEKVRAIRKEIPSEEEWAFKLRGDSVSDEETDDAATQLYPVKYAARDFLGLCQEQLSGASVEMLLKELCLNPAVPMSGDWPWWFSEFMDCVRELHAEWTAERTACFVTTEIGALVHDEMNFALSEKCLVLIDGLPRIGKTVSAKAFCEQRPGRARHVNLTSSNDEIGFLRAIAKSIGVSVNLNSKALELRQRIEEALQSGDLLLCLDEAHYLWPNLIDPRTVPVRINWLMTALEPVLNF